MESQEKIRERVFRATRTSSEEELERKVSEIAGKRLGEKGREEIEDVFGSWENFVRTVSGKLLDGSVLLGKGDVDLRIGNLACALSVDEDLASVAGGLRSFLGDMADLDWASEGGEITDEELRWVDRIFDGISP